ncbi:putative transcriptional repressor, partial [Stigmatella aurantiaca DW4/3-1]
EVSRPAHGSRGQSELPQVRQLLGLARKMDEDKLHALVTVAQVLLR